MFRLAAHPCLPITFNKQFFILGSLGLLSAVTILPNSADAFWPFSTNAGAAINSFVPSSDTPALVAVINTDPSARASVPLATSGDSALLSYSGPSGTLADIEDAPQSDTISVYVVRPGDTLSVIAKMFNVSVNTIIWANNLSGVKDIRAGQTLVILPISGVKKTVTKGDTLKSIAKKYDADAAEIAQFNGLDSTVALEIGSTLIIPGGEVVAAPVVKKVPARKTTADAYLGGSGPAQPGYYSSPVPGARVTQGIHGHNGVDLGKAPGATIVAAASGTVIVARNGGWNGGYGNYIVISHPNGTQTLYSHLKSAAVSPGQSVEQGETIGYMGSTGKSTGIHLHFEVRGAANPFAR